MSSRLKERRLPSHGDHGTLAREISEISATYGGGSRAVRSHKSKERAARRAERRPSRPGLSGALPESNHINNTSGREGGREMNKSPSGEVSASDVIQKRDWRRINQHISATRRESEYALRENRYVEGGRVSATLSRTALDFRNRRRPVAANISRGIWERHLQARADLATDADAVTARLKFRSIRIDRKSRGVLYRISREKEDARARYARHWHVFLFTAVALFPALFSARERARNYVRDNLYRRNQKVRGPGRRVDSRDCCSLQHVNLFYFPTRTAAPSPPSSPTLEHGREGEGRRRKRRKTTGKQSDSDSSGIQLRNILPIYSKLSASPPSLSLAIFVRSLRAEKFSSPRRHDGAAWGPLRYVPRRPRSCRTRG